MSDMERKLTTIVLMAVAIMAAIDIAGDFRQGSSWIHMAIETLLALAAVAATAAIWIRSIRVKRLNEALRRDLQKMESDFARVQRDFAQVQEDARKWKEESARHIKGLSQAIDEQLTRWGLSPAEKEIALLLLKGLSLKEIAQVRDTSERTVRQQSLMVYQKSGLAGRAELSAFFLEDLLAPTLHL